MKKMKKLLLSSLAICLSFGMIAQNQLSNIFLQDQEELEMHNSTNINNVTNLKAGGDTIWTEDFTGGMPAGWTVVDGNGMSYDWTISSASNITADYTNTTAIASTSGGNYMLLFGDNYNTGGGSTAMDAYFQTSAINLGTLSGGTGYPAVSIRWQQKFRNCCSGNSMSMTIQVSRDAAFTPGATTISYEANPGVAVNAGSADPEMTEVNISAVAGGNYTGDIYIRFHKINDSHYYWMIDDIELFESLDNDLINTASYFGTLGLPYYQIPDEQVSAIDFYAVSLNNGGVDQPNTTLTVDVNSGTFTGTSNSVYSVSGNIDTLVCSTQYTPSTSLGSHTITWTIASDSVDNVISNNTSTSSFEVTDNIFARDMDVVDGGRDNGGEAYEYGNYFDVITNQTLTYIDINISTNANVGAVVYGAVYLYDANSQAFVWQESTDDYILTSSNVSNGDMISLPLFSPLSLTGGEGYLVVAGAYGDGGTTDDLRITTSGTSAPGTSLIYLNGSSGLDWYWTTATPMVRMNFDPSWGLIDDNNKNAVLGQNTPNPFKDHTSINIELISSSDIALEITDISGKVVKHLELGLLGTGKHSININSDGLKSGIYYYSIISDKFTMTKKMIKQN